MKNLRNKVDHCSWQVLNLVQEKIVELRSFSCMSKNLVYDLLAVLSFLTNFTELKEDVVGNVHKIIVFLFEFSLPFLVVQKYLKHGLLLQFPVKYIFRLFQVPFFWKMQILAKMCFKIPFDSRNNLCPSSNGGHFLVFVPLIIHPLQNCFPINRRPEIFVEYCPAAFKCKLL